QPRRRASPARWANESGASALEFTIFSRGLASALADGAGDLGFFLSQQPFDRGAAAVIEFVRTQQRAVVRDVLAMDERVRSVVAERLALAVGLGAAELGELLLNARDGAERAGIHARHLDD